MKIQNVKFMLMAQDMDRGVAFYEALGLRATTTSPYWSELVHGDAIVALHGGGSGEHTQTGLGMQVDDLEAAVAVVRGAGGTVVREPYPAEGVTLLLAELRDPEGNGFTLSQWTGE